MKKYLFSILALAAMTFVACENNDIDNPNGGGSDFVAPTLELSQKKVELAAEAGDVKTVTVTTDQSVINAEVSYAAKNWLGASREGNVISIKALSTNYDSKERIDSVHVIVGEKGVTAEAYIVVVQGKSNKPVLELESTEDIILIKDKDASASVALNTNQSNISISLSDGGEAWLKAEIKDGKLVVSAISENSGEARSTTVTLTASTLTASIKVNQNGAPKSIIGTAYGTEGVIFWQNPENPKQVKIVSGKGEKRQWGPQISAGVSNDETLSGPEAAAKIKAHSEYNKDTWALGFCEGIGEGWYLPTKSEVKELFKAYNGIYEGATAQNPDSITPEEKAARAAFDGAMTSIGGVLLNTGAANASGDSFWTCVDTEDGQNAYYIRVGKLLQDKGKKTSTTRYVRCVKLVTIE